MPAGELVGCGAHPVVLGGGGVGRRPQQGEFLAPGLEGVAGGLETFGRGGVGAGGRGEPAVRRGLPGTGAGEPSVGGLDEPSGGVPGPVGVGGRHRRGGGIGFLFERGEPCLGVVAGELGGRDGTVGRVAEFVGPSACRVEFVRGLLELFRAQFVAG